VARIVFAISDTFTKLASESLPGTEVVSVRNAVALPIVAAMAWRLGGLRIFLRSATRSCSGRSVLDGIGTLAFVAALPHVMLGQSTVILLTVPIILVALSALIFREEVGWRRWSAIVVGFIGVFMVAGPLGGTPNSYLLISSSPPSPGRFATSSLGAWSGISLCDREPDRHCRRCPGRPPGAFRRRLEDVRRAGSVIFVCRGRVRGEREFFLYITALRTGAISVVAPFVIPARCLR